MCGALLTVFTNNCHLLQEDPCVGGVLTVLSNNLHLFHLLLGTQPFMGLSLVNEDGSQSEQVGEKL